MYSELFSASLSRPLIAVKSKINLHGTIEIRVQINPVENNRWSGRQRDAGNSQDKDYEKEKNKPTPRQEKQEMQDKTVCKICLCFFGWNDRGGRGGRRGGGAERGRRIIFTNTINKIILLLSQITIIL